MFKLNQDASVNGTCRQSEVMVAPSRLIEKFGPPIESDGYKVSGEYVFEDSEGSVFTVYDWKATTLYSPDYGFTPEYFWSLTTPMEFNVGGNKSAADFVEWLKKEVL
tara:strand:+ start:952 stop:1272 length:321 start_codon:yes stop_codon:yes gene_type:complete